jgi:hypothetical protein
MDAATGRQHKDVLSAGPVETTRAQGSLLPGFAREKAVHRSGKHFFGHFLVATRK